MAAPIDKRQAVLDAAMMLFTEHGFHATPTSEIARRAKVATGTLFHHFATKEALIDQLYLEIKSQLHTYLIEGLDAAAPVRSRCLGLLRRALAWAMTFPIQHRFLTMFAASPNLSSTAKEEGLRRFAFLGELLEEGKRQQVVKDLPLDLLHDLCGGMMMAAEAHFSSHPERYRDSRYVDRCLEALWDSVRR